MMEKNANTSPPGKNSDDMLEGLFISPLEDTESFATMEAEEARLLSPLRKPDIDGDAGSGTLSSSDEGDQHPFEAKPSAKFANPTQEQLMLRVAGELRSIKEDLLSIKQHFEVMKKNQPPQVTPHGEAAAPTAATPAQTVETSRSSDDAQQLLDDIRKLLLYLDRLLEALPEEKIEEFANSEFFNLYRHVFEKLGIS